MCFENLVDDDCFIYFISKSEWKTVFLHTKANIAKGQEIFFFFFFSACLVQIFAKKSEKQVINLLWPKYVKVSTKQLKVVTP